MGFPVGDKGVKQSSHHVKTSKVNLTVLLASVNFLLNLESLILRHKEKGDYSFTKSEEILGYCERDENEVRVTKER